MLMINKINDRFLKLMRSIVQALGIKRVGNKRSDGNPAVIKLCRPRADSITRSQ